MGIAYQVSVPCAVCVKRFVLGRDAAVEMNEAHKHGFNVKNRHMVHECYFFFFSSMVWNGSTLLSRLYVPGAKHSSFLYTLPV